ncbi:hypothetical protein D3G57_21255 [Escherichia coli]|nr:hypothetical protein [Escherichia coli]EFC1804677.1 hypothetical protein [Escherichia coli]EFN9688904.1 hypothetical protein [Escherichia coli]
MGKPTFRSFYDVVRELEDVYGHKELWLYSGAVYATPTEMINARHNWKSPKILKRNGRMVAERMDNSDSWQLVGDYKKPLFQHCAPPWQSCQIDDYFKGYYIIAP